MDEECSVDKTNRKKGNRRSILKEGYFGGRMRRRERGIYRKNLLLKEVSRRSRMEKEG